jgi:hypothetical protein
MINTMYKLAFKQESELLLRKLLADQTCFAASNL